MLDWRIEPSGPSHQREGFSCGKAPLDSFLLTLASQYEKRNLGRTYVLVKQGDRQVFGYYTIASGSLIFDQLPRGTGKKLPRHPVPVILLARLAVDRTMRGQRLGERLLIDALKRSLGLSESLGIHAVEVDAIDAEAKSFYENYGFLSLSDKDLHMYLPMDTIRASFLN